MKVELIRSTDNSKALIVETASICYGKETSGNPDGLIKHLFENGHHSVFEHVSFTFKIEGISRVCLAQLTRHRMASYTVRSQRYCNDSDREFYTPSALEEKYDLTDYYRTVKIEYDRLIEKGIKKEDARMLLPQAITTDLYMTINLRSLINFVKLRTHKSAQEEIRELANAMRGIVIFGVPELRILLGDE